VTRRGWLLFGAMCVIWGVPYLLIKVAVAELTPIEVVFLRSGLGGVLLLPWALRQGAVGTALAHWRPLALFAALEMVGPWVLLARAEQELSSSLTGLLVAAVPLVAAVASRVVGDADRLDRTRVLGLLVGVAGVGTLLGLDVGSGDLVAVGAVGLTVLGYATAPLMINHSLRAVPASGINAVALCGTALLYLPVAVPRLVSGPAPSGQAVAAVTALGVVCTALALVLFFALIAEAGANRALVITFVNPAVAVALGIVLLDEPFAVGTALGFPLVLLGCVLATRRSRAAAPQAAAEPAVAVPGERGVAAPPRG
jgi:drug/metabolite transporter (DMT)-like permease